MDDMEDFGSRRLMMRRPPEPRPTVLLAGEDEDDEPHIQRGID